ncbi:MAG TPA: chemotaxis-specific protein-glutamate methyltransferase CheB [Candidatus Xenobia bacterium]|jgi:two-component system chemotaxis response regulator CheB
MRAVVVEESRTVRAVVRGFLTDLGFTVDCMPALPETVPPGALVLVSSDLLTDDPRVLTGAGHVLTMASGAATGSLQKPFTRAALAEKLKALDLLPRIRVLIVDDAALARRLLTEALAAEPRLWIVGLATNGAEALDMLAEAAPDVVSLDIEMPVMDGLATLAALRKRDAALPVVMVSTLTERGAAATLDALALGAADYVTKPGQAVHFDDAVARLRAELVPRLLQFGAPRHAPTAVHVTAAQAVHRIDLLAIGTSTGGPEALTTVLAGLPRDLPVPVVVVQHMPPMFTRLLAERLTARGSLPATEARDGERLNPGRVYLAPGDFHLEVARQGEALVAVLQQRERENGCRPAVDVLFRSVAECCGRHALAVVMTGMGQDGLLGCERLHQVEARILAQDEASSVVWSMPGGVVRAGLADAVLPLEGLSTEIAHRVSACR